jgi:hypothetical protein
MVGVGVLALGGLAPVVSAATTGSQTAFTPAYRDAGKAYRELRGRGPNGHGGEHGGGGRGETAKRSDRGSATSSGGEITGRPVSNPGRPQDPPSHPSNPPGPENPGNGHNPDNSGNGTNNGHHNEGNRGNGRGNCHYPPSGALQVAMTGPNHTHRGRTVTLTGKVRHNGCERTSVKLGLYSSHDGATQWVQIRHGQVDARGNFSFEVPSYATHYYQAVVAAGDGHGMSSSAILKLELW